MTNKQKKILFYTIAGVASVATITYLVCYLIIVKNYSKTLTYQQAIETLDNNVANAEPITIEPDDNTDDVSTGSTLGDDDPNLVIDNN